MARGTATRMIGAGLAAALLLGITPPPRESAAEAHAAAPAPAPEPAIELAPQPAAIPAKPAPAPAREPFRVKSVLPIEGGMAHGEWHWDATRGPADGPLLITVDLEHQVISVFRDGHEIGAAVILYGATDKPTPLGVFPITQKKRHHISNLYGAPMPYMMRLTNDGVAIHSSNVVWGSASHGCIGVPDAFAAKLFAIAKLGDRVVITNGKRLEVPAA